MADFLISAVSTSYTGTEASDDFKNSRGNLRDITVDGGSGSDFLTIASGAKDSDGTDGERLVAWDLLPLRACPSHGLRVTDFVTR